MATERDRIWNATVRVAADPTTEITPDTVLAHLNTPLDRSTVCDTLTAMWELGVLRCADGGGRQDGTYRLNDTVLQPA